VFLSRIVLVTVKDSSIRSSADDDEIIHQLKQWFSHQENGHWLLLFDNYDDPKLPGADSPTGYDIRQYFPYNSQGAILISSRSRRLNFARELHLGKFDDQQQNLDILSDRSRRNMKAGKLFLRTSCSRGPETVMMKTTLTGILAQIFHQCYHCARFLTSYTYSQQLRYR
jgi:hypothetical protein